MGASHRAMHMIMPQDHFVAEANANLRTPEHLARMVAIVQPTRNPIWSIPLIIIAISASFAWTGFLAWGLGHILDVW